ADRALPDMRGDRRQHVVEDRGLPRQHRLHRGRRALERDMGDVDAVLELEQPFAGKVRRRAIAWARVAVLARIGLEQVDQLLTLFAGSDGCTVIISGAVTTSETGVKLLTGS